MSATTLHAGLAGLTIEHARRFEQHSRDGARRVGFVTKVLRFAFAPIDFLCGMLDRQTLRMKDQAVWFNGVRASIEGGAELSDSQGVTSADMIAELEKLQQVIRDVRVTFLKLEAQVKPTSRIGQRTRGLIAALGEVFDAVEGARWAALEREADDDIAAGRVSPTFANAADAIAYLNANA
jgi:hypothetical protein